VKCENSPHNSIFFCKVTKSYSININQFQFQLLSVIDSSSIMSINQIRNATQARNGRLRNVETDLNKTFARDNGRSASVSLKAAYTADSIMKEHPNSIEAKTMTAFDELHPDPDDQDYALLKEEIIRAVKEDPENSYLMNLPADECELRHEKNVSSLNGEFALYQRALVEAEELRLNLPALEEENRQMRERFEASQADLQVYMANHRKTLARFELRQAEIEAAQAEIEAAQAEFESSNESLGNYPKKVAE
jgi:lipopolysaccharide export system protein LptA